MTTYIAHGSQLSRDFASLRRFIYTVGLSILPQVLKGRKASQLNSGSYGLCGFAKLMRFSYNIRLRTISSVHTCILASHGSCDSQ